MPLAARRVAARTRTSRSSVVLAAICAVVARRVGYRELVFPVTSGNRFDRHLVNYVGPLVQCAIATVEIGGKLRNSSGSQRLHRPQASPPRNLRPLQSRPLQQRPLRWAGRHLLRL